MQAEGYICSAEDLWNVLLGVGAKGATIESVCADLVDAPNPETIRRYLTEQVTVETFCSRQRQTCTDFATALAPQDE